MVSMNGQLKIQDYGDMAPTESMRKGWTKVCTDMRTALSEWQAINATDLVAFNALLTKNSLQRIAAASPAIAVPTCALGPQTAAPTSGPSTVARGRRKGRGGL
jgi:hypothetical protein